MKALLILGVAIASNCFAQNLEGYYTYSKGVYNIEDGFILQGSTDYGGIQPNYLIDLSSDKAVREFLQYSRELRHLPVDERVALVGDYVKNALPHGEYDSAPYLEALEEYRNKGKAIPLKEYLRCEAGVCRENSLFTHLGLKEAGVDNRYVYAQVEQIVNGKSYVEDHAFVVMERNGELYTVDPYNSNFDQHRLKDVLGKELEIGKGMAVKIRKINDYPNLYIPPEKFHPRLLTLKNPCQILFKPAAANIDELMTKTLILQGMF